MTNGSKNALLTSLKICNNPLVALKNRNFRFYWLSMCISLLGTWMQNVAQPWLAYSLTRSPLKLSLVGAFQFTPVLFFTLFAGVLVDRYPKKKLLLCTQSAALVITFTLATLVWLERVRYWQILLCATAMGLVNALDTPTRQSFVYEMVGKADLLNANALNATVFNLARVFGPAIAGVLMANGGPAVCFYVNAISFAAVIIGLGFIKTAPGPASPQRTFNLRKDISNGLGYVCQNGTLLKTLVATAVICTFAINYQVLVPVLAKVVLKQQETGFAFLMSTLGLGSFIGALVMAAFSQSGPQTLILRCIPFLIALALIFTGCSKTYFLAGLGLAATGFCFVAFSATANTTIQLNTKNEYRGRVMSFYTLVFSGSAPLGNLYAGLITDRFGSRTGFIACGVMIILLNSLMLIWGRNALGPGGRPQPAKGVLGSGPNKYG